MNYTRIHSSWNPDRIGNCLAAKRSRVHRPCERRLVAVRRGNVVSVIDMRGNVLFSVSFAEEVVLAIVKDGHLCVTTADACVRKYAALTGKLVSETRPTPPFGGLGLGGSGLAARRAAA